jgi:hypothetical protein
MADGAFVASGVEPLLGFCNNNVHRIPFLLAVKYT